MFKDMQGEALNRLHATIHSHPQWQWEIDERHRFTKVAEGLLDLMGREREAVLGAPVNTFMTPTEAVRARRFFASRPKAFSCAISRHLHADGSLVALESDAVAIEDENGEFSGYRGVAHGVMDLTHAENVYRMMAVYDTAPSALCLIGRDGRYLAANAAYAAIHGVPSHALVGRKVAELMPGAGQSIRRGLKLLEAGQDVPAQEIEHHGKYYQMLANPVHNLMGQVIGITAALTDITDRKQAEQKLADINRQLEYYANNDHLTGLPNRRRVDEVLADEVRRAMRNQHPLSVLMIDVDYFKKYNDHYGHLRGDDCLRIVAAELHKSLHRYGDVVGRYGGEEFIAVLPGTDAIGALKVSGAILHAIGALEMPHAQSRYGKLTLSIGAANLGHVPHGHGVEEICDTLLQAADRALYAAKLSGRNTVHGMSTGELDTSPDFAD
ncbi:sensor domain-containing diguanylate cyclase [Dyella nitratireducens]|uniref:diguanylate cyclase n=1 Tax=Dyella nitratireducens TaxID=1849580 RepID=A0ABQ1FY47_9GAMM|nr:diguanylate cyclase [Dyella nitratireducens]GGA32072.1 diguanylate cyclase [Dyella nitratireducens]GLQ42786.1 diguanylate cyclase [Dyella nitratireducens]